MRPLRTPAYVSNAYWLASIAVVALFLVVMALAVLAYFSSATIKHASLYKWLLREDGLIESLTAILLAAAAVLSLIAARKLSESLRWARPFLFLFAAFSLLMALEEVSWGQRFLRVESGAFFTEHSDQKEINAHNVMQKYLSNKGFAVTKTRQAAAIVLFVYGVIFPILSLFEPVSGVFRKLKLIVPPPALVLGFLVGSLLAWFDRPSGSEEEIGEFLFALCFVLLVPLWLIQQRHGAAQS